MLLFFNELKTAVLNEDFYETYEIIEKIKTQNNAFEYISPILKLMESNPAIDYGEPGPLVHFMETYYKKGYEKLLLESVERCPTTQTIWMINRIMNDPNLEDKQKYLDVLYSVSNKSDISENVASEASNFLRYHENIGKK